MKFASSILVSTLLGISSLSYASPFNTSLAGHFNQPFYETTTDFYTEEQNELEVENKVCSAIPSFVPESCSFMDQALCALDLKNSELIHHLMHIFSKTKGDSIIFTTENFEEILAALRALEFTSEDAEKFKHDPKVCIDRLRPIVGLAARHANVDMDEDFIKQVCEKTSLAFRTVSNIVDVTQVVGSDFNYGLPYTPIAGAAVAIALLKGPKTAAAITTLLITAVMIYTASHSKAPGCGH